MLSLNLIKEIRFIPGTLFILFAHIDCTAQLSIPSSKWHIGIRSAAVRSLTTTQDHGYLGHQEAATTDLELGANVHRTLGRKGVAAIGIEAGATRLSYRYVFSRSTGQRDLQWTYLERFPKAYYGRLFFTLNALRTPRWGLSSSIFLGWMRLSSGDHFDPNVFYSASPRSDGYTLNFKSSSLGSGQSNFNAGSLISASRMLGEVWFLSVDLGMQFGFQPTLHTQQIEANVIDPLGTPVAAVSSTVTTKGDRFFIGFGVGYLID
ncbi:MAG: hypothetical protein KTR24_14715 [Saprospiraceae bacterium]|nr:hypothetical protein [Saprospiraceae bacterium]